MKYAYTLHGTSMVHVWITPAVCIEYTYIMHEDIDKCMHYSDLYHACSVHIKCLAQSSVSHETCIIHALQDLATSMHEIMYTWNILKHDLLTLGAPFQVG